MPVEGEKPRDTQRTVCVLVLEFLGGDYIVGAKITANI